MFFFNSGGFVPLPTLLELDQFKGVTETDIRRIVENNEKKRFHLESKDGVLKIRANQGHSLKVIRHTLYIESYYYAYTTLVAGDIICEVTAVLSILSCPSGPVYPVPSCPSRPALLGRHIYYERLNLVMSYMQQR